MANVLNLKHINSYIKNEDALDGAVERALWILIIVVVAGVLAWFGFNLIRSITDGASKASSGGSNPGKGNEFNGSPFGG